MKLINKIRRLFKSSEQEISEFDKALLYFGFRGFNDKTDSKPIEFIEQLGSGFGDVHQFSNRLIRERGGNITQILIGHDTSSENIGIHILDYKITFVYGNCSDYFITRAYYPYLTNDDIYGIIENGEEKVRENFYSLHGIKAV